MKPGLSHIQNTILKSDKESYIKNRKIVRCIAELLDLEERDIFKLLTRAAVEKEMVEELFKKINFKSNLKKLNLEKQLEKKKEGSVRDINFPHVSLDCEGMPLDWTDLDKHEVNYFTQLYGARQYYLDLGLDKEELMERLHKERLDLAQNLDDGSPIIVDAETSPIPNDELSIEILQRYEERFTLMYENVSEATYHDNLIGEWIKHDKKTDSVYYYGDVP
jgi:hypothetical protein